jgi:hypothetical protein
MEAAVPGHVASVGLPPPLLVGVVAAAVAHARHLLREELALRLAVQRRLLPRRVERPPPLVQVAPRGHLRLLLLVVLGRRRGLSGGILLLVLLMVVVQDPQVRGPRPPGDRDAAWHGHVSAAAAALDDVLVVEEDGEEEDGDDEARQRERGGGPARGRLLGGGRRRSGGGLAAVLHRTAVQLAMGDLGAVAVGIQFQSQLGRKPNWIGFLRRGEWVLGLVGFSVCC